MRHTLTRPTGVERRLGAHELIVSKTDLKGVITYANDVFLRIACYDEDQVVGQPHNLIRHPDMPRAVFRLLWDGLAARREVFAYVNNLAADGAHYWVLAHVTPSVDRQGQAIGYHSNRRAPDPRAVATVESLYALLRAEELRHDSSPAGLAASTQLLETALVERGQNYDEFFWDITPGAGA